MQHPSFHLAPLLTLQATISSLISSSKSWECIMLMMLIAIISAAWNTPKYSLYGFNTKAFQWKKNNLKIPTYYLFCRNYIWFEINILFNRKENKLFQLIYVGLNNYQKIVKYIIDRDNNFPSIKVGSVQIFSNIRIIEKENFEPGRLVLKSIWYSTE